MNYFQRRRVSRGLALIYGGSPSVVKTDDQMLAEADLWESVGEHDLAAILREGVERGS